VGAEVGLSTAAVHERVKKMLDKGVIRRFSISVDPERVGLNFTGFVAIRNDGGIHCRDVAPRLRAMPQVEELHSVAGEYDFLAKVRTTHARALEDVIYQIKAIPGVARTTSTVVLNTEFEDRPLDQVVGAVDPGGLHAGIQGAHHVQRGIVADVQHVSRRHVQPPAAGVEDARIGLAHAKFARA
jgi:Lrp/AsnC family leucine-responsive transcriptional regulator